MKNRRFLPSVLVAVSLVVVICLFSCSQLQVIFQEGSQQADSEESAASAEGEVTPSEFYTDFSQMVRRVQRMQRRSIENMGDAELLSLGNPVSEIRRNRLVLDEETRVVLSQQIGDGSRNYKNISEDNFQNFANNIAELLLPVTENHQAGDSTGAEALKRILLQLNRSASSAESCRELFNVVDGHVILILGDNLNTANFVCPEGSVFLLTPGVYESQSIEGSKANNAWIGVGESILDGGNSTARAFDSGLNRNTLRNLEIRNYTDHGVYGVRTQNVHIRDLSFSGISPEKTGQEHGAVMFSNSGDITIENSFFENVASSVRLRDSRGPLVVTGNTAINSGRNFFQCDKCNGGDIRINRNSMDHRQQYGQPPLEDWINIYESNGTETNPIQVNHNRARGHSDSNSGSFIMLADNGGTYQEAIGNIGVNPGQVGIGIAGGQHIKVERNIMYSESWEGSNVAFYSADYTSPCGNHTYTPGTNIANWRNSNGTPNRAWTDGNCGLTNGEIRNLVREDRSLGPGIWNEWSRD